VLIDFILFLTSYMNVAIFLAAWLPNPGSGGISTRKACAQPPNDPYSVINVRRPQAVATYTQELAAPPAAS